MVIDARRGGLPHEAEQELYELVAEFEDIFRLRLDASEPADIEPMKMQTIPDDLYKRLRGNIVRSKEPSYKHTVTRWSSTIS
jgi:hypothetical protein